MRRSWQQRTRQFAAWTLAACLGPTAIGAPLGTPNPAVTATAKSAQPGAGEQRVTQTRSALVTAIDAVLARWQQSTPEVRQGWLDYLKLTDVQTALADSGPDATARLLVQLDKLQRRLTVDRPGIEEPTMLALRAAAHKHAVAIQLASLDLPTETERRLTQLRALTSRYEQQPTVELAQQIGALVGWLDDAETAPAEVAAVRTRWSRPNFSIQISEAFAAQFVKKEIDQTSDQTTNILGTVTRGPAHTQGKLAIDFRPNDKQAEIWLQLRGEIHADRNVGHNGPATIYSGSVTNFVAHKPLLIDTHRGLAAKPAQATANTQVNIRHIHVDPKHLPNLLDGPFTKAAWKRSNKLHHAAEQEASRIAGNRVAQELDEQGTTALKNAQQYFEHYAIVGPERSGETAVLSSRSTDEWLQVLLNVASAQQLGAPTAPPEMNPGAPIAAAIHESFLNNWSTRYLLQGATHDDESLEKLAKMVAGEVPLALRVYSSSPYWSLTLRESQPFTLRIDDGTLDLTVHVHSWLLEERRFACPLDIRARYGMEVTNFGMRFTRQGDVSVEPGAGHQPTSEERQVLLPLVVEKAQAVFPASGRFNNLVIPDGGTFGVLGTLRLETLRCDDGWLTLEYRQ